MRTYQEELKKVIPSETHQDFFNICIEMANRFLHDFIKQELAKNNQTNEFKTKDLEEYFCQKQKINSPFALNNEEASLWFKKLELSPLQTLFFLTDHVWNSEDNKTPSKITHLRFTDCLDIIINTLFTSYLAFIFEELKENLPKAFTKEELKKTLILTTRSLSVNI